MAIWILDYGLFGVHADRHVIGVCGFLIRTNAGEQILVDTGFPAKYTRDSDAATTEYGLDAFGTVLRCEPENLPATQLQMTCTSLEDFDPMIQTHTHIDHVGVLDAHPHAPILMAKAERTLPRPLYWAPVDPPATMY